MSRSIRTFMEMVNSPTTLYHGTSIPALLSILINRRVSSSPLGSDDFHEGVSLTRSKDMAERFAMHSDVLWWDHNVYQNQDTEFPMTHGAILVFGRDTLETEHELTPVDFYGDDEDDEDEEEERTDGDIADLDLHLLAIKCSSQDIDVFLKAAEQVSDLLTSEEVEMLKRLRNHPLRD